MWHGSVYDRMSFFFINQYVTLECWLQCIKGGWGHFPITSAPKSEVQYINHKTHTTDTLCSSRMLLLMLLPRLLYYLFWDMLSLCYCAAASHSDCVNLVDLHYFYICMKKQHCPSPTPYWKAILSKALSLALLSDWAHLPKHMHFWRTNDKCWVTSTHA